ncbi:hypothetical protein EMPS_04528 [Entomortierella parvispora]|uniref:Uncharacterized protein n=1 Tax=Entomortierella parvispora TaxID=205924 RepID=A0A9P3H8M5_9FUNG|nr:hypothetical protein EMPS_04528 [Entomortierella parvispora]
MKITSWVTLAMVVGFVSANPIETFGKPYFIHTHIREDSYSQAVPPTVDAASALMVDHSKTEDGHNRHASQATKDDKNPYVWDFETYSQANYYGDRQRFNGDGCVNFRCIEVRSYKGLPDKEYIFYDGDDCYGAVILRTTDEKRESISQPFKPCSIRVQYPSNYNGTGVPPAGTDLATYPQPRYKGKSSTFVGKQCHNLKENTAVMSFQGHEDWTYTFFKDADCKGKQLEKNKGPDSRTNTYMVPMSVKIE